jgi:shikimate kinase
MGGAERTILLAGMMGSGKSTVGRRLADKLGCRFIDTDEEVEAVAGKPIAEIFARDGEARFRELERTVLDGLPERRAVVALGGGAIVSLENRDLLRTKGVLVLLEARPETLAVRIGTDRDRPLLGDAVGEERVDRLREILDERSDAYATAVLRVPTDGCTVGQVCESVLRGLGRGEAA